MKTFRIVIDATVWVLIVAMLAIGSALYGQQTFATSVELVTVYKAPDAETINANGIVYLAFNAQPIQIDAGIITTEGDIQEWIVVRKLAGGRSLKLKPFEPSKFLYEHQGEGEYEVTTLDKSMEPVFSYFVIGKKPPDPDVPPPVSDDFSELLKIAMANVPKDQTSVNALGSAWLAQIPNLYPPAVTLDQARRDIGKSRGEALSAIRDPGVMGWNKFLMAVDGWFSAQTTMPKERYLKAMAALGKAMADYK